MPCIKDIEVGGNRLGLWRIDGSEDRLAEQYPELATLSGKHPKTRLQRYASRLLLAEMLGEMPLVVKDQNGRPALQSGTLEVSISHTDGYAAVLLGQGQLGVDVQHYKPNVMEVRNRFLDENELKMAPDIEHATLFWAAKEAIYKYNGKPGLDFKESVRIHGADSSILRCSFTYDDSRTDLNLGWKELKKAMLVWTL